MAQALAVATANDPQTDQVDKIVKQLNQTDKLSVYVKNVEYKCTKKDLFEHFGVCGDITRATISKNRYTGQAKGYPTTPLTPRYAYIEFKTEEGVENALNLTDSVLLERKISVRPQPHHLSPR